MKKWMTNVLLVVFIIIFVVSLWFLLDYYLESRKQKSTYDELSHLVEQNRPPETTPQQNTDPTTGETEETVTPTEPPSPWVEIEHPVTGETMQILREYAPLFQMNPDLVGWIKIDDTVVNYPVMHAPDRPDYYLTRDFYKESSNHGCIYIEEACDVNTPSDNVTIYGHRMRDGSMFAALHGYLKEDFFKEHPTITFDTLTEHHTYEILSVFTTTASVGQGFVYHTFIDAADEAAFQKFVSDCKRLSMYDTGVDAVYGDKLITLSTCEYTHVNGRLVVVAKRVD